MMQRKQEDQIAKEIKEQDEKNKRERYKLGLEHQIQQLKQGQREEQQLKKKEAEDYR